LTTVDTLISGKTPVSHSVHFELNCFYVR